MSQSSIREQVFVELKTPTKACDRSKQVFHSFDFGYNFEKACEFSSFETNVVKGVSVLCFLDPSSRGLDESTFRKWTSRRSTLK